MTRYGDEIERKRHDRAIGVWDNEGGASVRTPGDEQYGRRIEADRSWTVHVFTGIPGNAQGQSMTGLSRSVAIDGVLSLNCRNEGRPKEHMSGILRARLLLQSSAADRR